MVPILSGSPRNISGLSQDVGKLKSGGTEMRGRISGILAVVLALGVPAIGVAAGEGLAGLWNIEGGGTLDLKADGTFSGKPKDMDGFAGKWVVNGAGLLVLTRDDGMAAECKYTLAGTKLTLADCPAAGAYAKSQ
jgi:hypothetical protein